MYRARELFASGVLPDRYTKPQASFNEMVRPEEILGCRKLPEGYIYIYIQRLAAVRLHKSAVCGRPSTSLVYALLYDGHTCFACLMRISLHLYDGCRCVDCMGMNCRCVICVSSLRHAISAGGLSAGAGRYMLETKDCLAANCG